MDRKEEFLKKVFLTDKFEIVPLRPDASTRKYWRILKGKSTFILMDGNAVSNRYQKFIQISELLKQHDVYAPSILAHDFDEGFMLIEDLGDGTFTRLLELSGNEKELYAMATEVLTKVISIKKKPDYIDVFSDDVVVRDICYFVDWYYPMVMGKPLDEKKREEFIAIVKKLLPLGRGVPNSLVLWDYHVDNIMMLDNKTCAVIDFQDAYWGPITYDIMSLLEDRRGASEEVQNEMKDLFFKSLKDVKRIDFENSYRFFSMFRNMRVLGRFSILLTRGKGEYMKYIPNLWKMLDRTLSCPNFVEMKKWVDKNLPKKYRVAPTQKPINKAMILAAGRGSRMKHLTNDVPKPLIEVNGRAMIDYKFDLLKDVGIKDVVVNVCYHGDKIIEHIKRHERDFNVAISEEEVALETGGGIKNALHLLGENPFFSLNSDELWNDTSYKPVMWQMIDKWNDDEYDMILLITPMSSTNEHGRDHGDYKINKKDRIERNVQKKPGGGYDYFYTGIALMSPKIFEGETEEKFSMVKMFDKAEEKGRLGYVIIHDEIFHVGTPEDKKIAEMKFKG
ncbi:MAG: phosphotransferase [Lactobacillus sp.]|jgi:aminoglycoside/choline kinase family phosphotransferase/choline kinase|nr:phosphotransferase [Lactobacillus sp.]